jgi:Ca-activated chloride channel family protein
VPLHGLVSPSHRVAVDFSGPNEARVRLADDESLPANRDFVIRYRLADGAIETGLLLDPPSQPGGDGRFMLLLEPPARPASSMVPPRDFLYVVDVSGSMHGFPLETTVALVREMAAQLRPVDSFNLLLFSGRSQLLSPRSLPATPENVAAAVSILEGKRGGGGTELHAAMELALSLPIEDGKARIISVITDGYLDMEPELFELVRRNLGRSSLFAFGIGSAVNRHLMEGLARAGRGEPIIVSNPDAAQAAATAFRQMIESPVLTGVQLSFDGFVADQLAPWPVPDVFARRPVVVVGRWKGEAAGRIRISGRSGDRDWQAELDVARAGSLETGGIVGRFWARQRIAELSDMQELRLDESRKAEVIGLGLEYNLLTKYTSFVAVDEVVRRMSGDPIQKVAQPSLLPQGVSNLAVGGDVPTTPEPATVLLLGTAAAMLAAVGWRRWRQQLQNAAAGNQEGGGGAGRSGRAEYAPAHHGDAFVDGDKP